MKRINNFDNFYLNEGYEGKSIKINKNWIDNATDDQLKKIIFAVNDGQGDTNLHTLDDLADLFGDYNSSNFDLIKILYDEYGGNMAKAAYFDGEYKKIYWDF